MSEQQSDTLLPDTALGAFRIVRWIGRGGMGEVYEGVEEITSRRVALKVLRPDANSKDDQLKRFISEAKTLGQVTNENVVSLYSIGEERGLQFIAMEFVDGAPFGDLLTQYVLSADEATLVILQLLRGLAALHSHNIIHRDVKPANLILKYNGSLKILDLGIAKQLGERDLTQAGLLVGTVSYLAPEIIYGAPATARSDLWAAGAIFYECLSGRQLTGQQGPPTQIDFPKESAAWTPAPIRQIISKMCSPHPETRYATAEQVIADLEAFRLKRPLLPVGTLSLLAKKIENLSTITATMNSQEISKIIMKRAFAISALQSNTALVPQKSDKTEVMSIQTGINLDQTAVQKALDSIRPRVEWTPHLPPQPQSERWPSVKLTAAIGLTLAVSLYYTLQPHKKTEPIRLAASQIEVPSAKAQSGPITPVGGDIVWAKPAFKFTLAWSRDAEPAAKVQISKVNNFSSLEADENITGRQVELGANLPEGKYFWRLIQANQTHGPFPLIVGRLEPVKLLEPAAKALVDISDAAEKESGNVIFSWECKPAAKIYRVQISRSNQFGNLLLESQSKTCELPPATLGGGVYFWRVQVDSPAEGAMWSEVRELTVEDRVMKQARRKAASPVHENSMEKNLTHSSSAGPAASLPPSPMPAPAPRAPAAVLAVPRIENPRSGSQILVGARAVPFVWSKVDGAEGYVVQFSKDEQFTNPISRRVTDSNFSFPTHNLSEGRTYFRVSAEKIGAQPAWSDTGYLENPNR